MVPFFYSDAIYTLLELRLLIKMYLFFIYTFI